MTCLTMPLYWVSVLGFKLYLLDSLKSALCFVAYFFVPGVCKELGLRGVGKPGLLGHFWKCVLSEIHIFLLCIYEQ